MATRLIRAVAFPALLRGVLSKRSTSTMSGYKFKYFGFPGRGEAVRLALVINGIDFENDVVERQRWVETEKAIAPYGGLPTLEINGEVRAQTGALLRYVGRIGDKNMYPTDPLEALKVDEALDFADEVTNVVLASAIPKKYGHPTFADEEAKRVQRETIAAELLAPRFAKLESLIAENDQNGLIFTDYLTIAELKVMKFMKTMFDHLPANFFENYPRAEELYSYVENVPEVKAWYEKQQQR